MALRETEGAAGHLERSEIPTPEKVPIPQPHLNEGRTVVAALRTEAHLRGGSVISLWDIKTNKPLQLRDEDGSVVLSRREQPTFWHVIDFDDGGVALQCNKTQRFLAADSRGRISTKNTECSEAELLHYVGFQVPSGTCIQIASAVASSWFVSCDDSAGESHAGVETAVDLFLQDIQLEEWIPTFARENVDDLDKLANLTDQDLKGFGLPLGPRKNLLCALRDGQRTPRQAMPNVQVGLRRFDAGTELKKQGVWEFEPGSLLFRVEVVMRAPPPLPLFHGDVVQFRDSSSALLQVDMDRGTLELRTNDGEDDDSQKDMSTEPTVAFRVSRMGSQGFSLQSVSSHRFVGVDLRRTRFHVQAISAGADEQLQLQAIEGRWGVRFGRKPTRMLSFKQRDKCGTTGLTISASSFSVQVIATSTVPRTSEWLATTQRSGDPVVPDEVTQEAQPSNSLPEALVQLRLSFEQLDVAALAAYGEGDPESLQLEHFHSQRMATEAQAANVARLEGAVVADNTFFGQCRCIEAAAKASFGARIVANTVFFTPAHNEALMVYCLVPARAAKVKGSYQVMMSCIAGGEVTHRLVGSVARRFREGMSSTIAHLQAELMVREFVAGLTVYETLNLPDCCPPPTVTLPVGCLPVLPVALLSELGHGDMLLLARPGRTFHDLLVVRSPEDSPGAVVEFVSGRLTTSPLSVIAPAVEAGTAFRVACPAALRLSGDLLDASLDILRARQADSNPCNIACFCWSGTVLHAGVSALRTPSFDLALQRVTLNQLLALQPAAISALVCMSSAPARTSFSDQQSALENALECLMLADSADEGFMQRASEKMLMLRRMFETDSVEKLEEEAEAELLSRIMAGHPGSVAGGDTQVQRSSASEFFDGALQFVGKAGGAVGDVANVVGPVVAAAKIGCYWHRQRQEFERGRISRDELQRSIERHTATTGASAGGGLFVTVTSAFAAGATGGAASVSTTGVAATAGTAVAGTALAGGSGGATAGAAVAGAGTAVAGAGTVAGSGAVAGGAVAGGAGAVAGGAAVAGATTGAAGGVAVGAVAGGATVSTTAAAGAAATGAVAGGAVAGGAIAGGAISGGSGATITAGGTAASGGAVSGAIAGTAGGVATGGAATGGAATVAGTTAAVGAASTSSGSGAVAAVCPACVATAAGGTIAIAVGATAAAVVLSTLMFYGAKHAIRIRHRGETWRDEDCGGFAVEEHRHSDLQKARDLGDANSRLFLTPAGVSVDLRLGFSPFVSLGLLDKIVGRFFPVFLAVKGDICTQDFLAAYRCSAPNSGFLNRHRVPPQGQGTARQRDFGHTDADGGSPWIVVVEVSPDMVGKEIEWRCGIVTQRADALQLHSPD